MNSKFESSLLSDKYTTESRSDYLNPIQKFVQEMQREIFEGGADRDSENRSPNIDYLEFSEDETEVDTDQDGGDFDSDEGSETESEFQEKDLDSDFAGGHRDISLNDDYSSDQYAGAADPEKEMTTIINQAFQTQKKYESLADNMEKKFSKLLGGDWRDDGADENVYGGDTQQDDAFADYILNESVDQTDEMQRVMNAMRGGDFDVSKLNKNINPAVAFIQVMTREMRTKTKRFKDLNYRTMLKIAGRIVDTLKTKYNTGNVAKYGEEGMRIAADPDNEIAKFRDIVANDPQRKRSHKAKGISSNDRRNKRSKRNRKPRSQRGGDQGDQDDEDDFSDKEESIFNDDFGLTDM